MAKVKVFFFATESLTESQTGQKLDAPEFHSGGIKMTWKPSFFTLDNSVPQPVIQ